ncbi:hypothetical protein EDD21DRAFT_374735 [Dissophora ornata]|nr:hypothetical protein EDD21DRAFT_374735 [Dissophora ornata]
MLIEESSYIVCTGNAFGTAGFLAARAAIIVELCLGRSLPLPLTLPLPPLLPPLLEMDPAPKSTKYGWRDSKSVSIKRSSSLWAAMAAAEFLLLLLLLLELLVPPTLLSMTLLSGLEDCDSKDDEERTTAGLMFVLPG